MRRGSVSSPRGRLMWSGTHGKIRQTAVKTGQGTQGHTAHQRCNELCHVVHPYSWLRPSEKEGRWLPPRWEAGFTRGENQGQVSRLSAPSDHPFSRTTPPNYRRWSPLAPTPLRTLAYR
jgi:hypothetical protein